MALAPASRAVLVTGCSTGIGRATAERLARGGWRVYASARRIESVKDLEAAGCIPLQLDVSDEASMQRAVREVESREGAVGVLVNNAGYGSLGAIEEVPPAEMRRQFETNVFGLVRMCQLVLPGMRRQGWGKIVNVSSMGGRMTLPGGGIYHGTKYAVEAISDALRFETRGFGIDVIIIEPGTIKTEFGNTAIDHIKSVPPADGGPYAEFNRVGEAQVRGAYEGPMAMLAGTSDQVARVIERAITARRPRTRYPVTFGARLMMGLRRLLGDRGFDAFLRTQFPTPQRQRG
jgi:NAD(P)-dependent dehydrogenase (short-subunit alcohol dehydrogenase family)